MESRGIILLDLDGTLVDSQPGILSSCRAALRELGHNPDPVMEIASIIGPPIQDVMRYLLAQFGDDRVTEATDAYRKDYGARGLLFSELYDGIPDTLADLKQAGGTLYLATSKRVEFAQRILDNKGIAGLFSGVYGSTPDRNIDHKPELIAHLLRERRLSPQHCIMVGDRKFDIVGAHANKVRAVGVLWGYGSRQELEAAGADMLLQRPSELAEMFNAS